MQFFRESRRAAPALHQKKEGFSRIWPLMLVSLLAAFLLCFALPQCASAQENYENAQEIVANLCTGRVVIGVAKDGIVVATLEDPIEPQTRPPMVVPVSEDRIAILLGAADWWLPDERRELANISKELPDLQAGQGRPRGPRLQSSNGGGAGSEATDIEQIANGLLGRLAYVADHIHGNLNLGDQPILQMVLVDYAPDYGPEVWLVTYAIDQEPEQGDFWQTRIRQPQYTQLWPPEKGQPRGLIEVSYPEQPNVESLISGGDARVSQAISATPGMREVSQAILDGQIQKQTAVDVATFLRACLGAKIVPNARMIEAELNEKRGVGWFVKPPAEEQATGSEQARHAGAPSLRKPSGQ